MAAILIKKREYQMGKQGLVRAGHLQPKRTFDRVYFGGRIPDKRAFDDGHSYKNLTF